MGFFNDNKLLNDRQLRQLYEETHFIEPFVSTKVKDGVISYGLSHSGYDIRIDNKFKVPVEKGIYDVKRNLEKRYTEITATSGYYILPPNAYVLGVSVETFKIPPNIIGIAVGKSTYARIGVFCNITPLEACLPSYTEVLTKNGWVNIKDIRVNDEILTLNPETFTAKFSPVRKKYSYDFNGKLHVYKGKSIYQECTENHKVFCGIRNTQNNTTKASYIESYKVFGKYNRYFSNLINYEGEPIPEYFNINGIKIKSNVWLRFYGCWLGDGSAYIQYKKNKPHGYVVKLAVVNKKEKRDYFRKVLTEMNIKFYEHKYGFVFHNKSICQYLLQFGHAKEKYIDKQYFKYSGKDLLPLFEGLIHSDGNLETLTYTTTSKQLANDVQQLAFWIGMKAIIREISQNVFGTRIDRYIIRFVKNRKWIKLNPTKQYLKHYKGIVYDLTVDSHIFLIRQKNRVLWTGNSWQGKLVIEIANLSRHPAKIYCNEGIAQILFFKIDQPQTTYSGKYQNQKDIRVAMVEKVGGTL